MRWLASIALFAISLFQGSVVGQVPSSALPSASSFQYTRKIWRVADGLPEDTVQALAESPQGVLWVGTTGGLTRFDGSRLQSYDAGHAGFPSANSFFCVTVTRDGAVWAGTEGGGLLRLSEGKDPKVYAGAEGLVDGFIRSVFEDDRGRLWVGTDGGLFYKNGARFEEYRTDRKMQPLAVHSIAEDRQHRLWIGGSRLFTIDSAGHEQDFAQPAAFGENRVKRIFQTSDGTVWIGTVGGLQRLRNGRIERVPGIPFTVRSLLESGDGTLWIGTIGGGLWSLRTAKDGHDLLERVSQPSLLPSDTVLTMLRDDQRQIWIGTQAGLVRLSETPVEMVRLPQGGDPDFETISGDSDGNVWVAAQRLYLIHNDVARPARYGDGSTSAARNIFRARNGDLWIGTDGGGAYRVREDGATTHFTAPGQLTNNFVRGFMETRDGTVWLACDEGVSLIGAPGIRKLTEADGLAYFSIRSLLQDRDNSVWIGTDRGLSHWRNGQFLQDEATVTLAHEKVWSILQDREGTLWFGTRDHGLFRFSDNTVEHLTTADGLPTNSIYQLLQERRGTYWITGPNTIASIREAELQASSIATAHPLSVSVYTMPFGAEGAQLYGGRQPSGYLAPDDSVWFPTNRGAAHITVAEPPVGPGPRAYLEEVREDGLGVSAGDNLDILARVSRISFRFSAVFLRPQEGVRFRYRLQGFDKAWNLADNTREATYTNLPAGHYRFLVTAYDTARPGDASGFELTVEKRPFFYQTWWFYTLCVVLLAGFAWMLYELRLRRVRNQFAAVLQERSRLARELHDTVIQGCTGISALLEAVAITPKSEDNTREELLNIAREQARSTVSEARQVVWDVRHEHEGEVELVGALRKLAAQNQRESGALVAFHSGTERLSVKASIAHEVLMTAREAITNALQHSGSPLVDVDLRLRGPELMLSIADQGCGLAASPAAAAEKGHFGILGMRERAQRIGARLRLEGSLGNGTRVELVIARASLSNSVARSA